MTPRRSRRRQQLGELHDAVRQGLPPQAQLFVASDHEAMPSNLAGCPLASKLEAGCGMLVRLAMDTATSAFTGESTLPTVTLAPAFAGSWVVDSIRVTLGKNPQTRQRIALSRPAVAESDVIQNGLRLDPTIASALHYARCLPLSVERHDLAYRSTGSHALVIVHFLTGDSSYDCIDEDARIIVEQLRSLDDVTALTLLPEEAADRPLTRKLGALIARRFPLTTQVVESPAEQAQDLFALFGKCDVVMAGGTSLYADAIVARAPVFVWRTPQPGTTPIAQAWRSFLSHRDAGRLTRTQRRCLDDLLQHLEREGTCKNDRRVLHNLLADISVALAKDWPCDCNAMTDPVQDNGHPGWIFSPTPSTRKKPVPDRIKAHTQRTKSLARKFNESPRRFARDSSRLWAKPFKPWL